MSRKLNDGEILNGARETLQIESEAIVTLSRSLDEHFSKAVKLMLSTKGRVVTSGMGKAGIIGQKFSATLSSTGTPSFWVHPAEAVHGDLGRMAKEDCIVVLSYSGETDEIKKFLPFLKNLKIPIIAITGNRRSTLAAHAHAVLDVAIHREACPLGLAPTTSTTVMLSLCDALAVALQKLKGFKEKDFAMFHPAGSLGNKLFLRVRDLMRTGTQNPEVSSGASVKEVLAAITHAKAGAASIVDENGVLKGIFTDGDLRRNLEIQENLLDKRIGDCMTKNPVTVKDDMLAGEALILLKKHKIDEVPVVDKRRRLVGMLDIQDLVRVGIV